MLQETRTENGGELSCSDEIVYGDWFRRNVIEGTCQVIGIYWSRQLVKPEAVVDVRVVLNPQKEVEYAAEMEE